MLKKLVLILTVLSISILVKAQKLTPIQKAWLYKIVSKTPSLNRNWNSYFIYYEQKPSSLNNFVDESGKVYAKEVIRWEQLIDSVVKKPDLLSVDFDSIKKSSPGLIANASVRLTLWELYYNLKTGLEEEEPFTVNPVANYFYKQMFRAFPTDYKSKGELKKKYKHVLYNVLNPSHHLKTKIASVEQLKKATTSQKKRIFAQWHKLITQYVEKRTKEYFSLFAGDDVFYKGMLLAVGDGSGTSGLLREYERAGDLKIETGTGKGIGLFTYKVKSRRDKLLPEEKSDYKFKELEKESVLLHLSLWGIDGKNKPLIRISKGDKSYLLFNSIDGDLSPDKNHADGISYYDQIDKFELKEIIDVEQELNEKGGLLSIYSKELELKTQIQSRIDELGLEIDSIRKLGNKSELAIQNRKNKINVNLSNLTDKERRLADLQRKISLEYSKINRAKEKLAKMKYELGANIQEWSLIDSVYYFADGTEFNVYTQDLIFYKDSVQEDIEVKLIAAPIAFKGSKKDEVQLYINTTGGVDDYKKRQEAKVVIEVDTLISKTVFFRSNSYKVPSVLTEAEKQILSDLFATADALQKKVHIQLTAFGVDTALHKNIQSDKLNYQIRKNEKLYTQSRRVDLLVLDKRDSVLIKLDGFTDAGNTKLNQLKDRKNVNKLNSKEQTLNPILSAMRVFSVFNGLLIEQLVAENDKVVFIAPMNKELPFVEIKRLIKN